MDTEPTRKPGKPIFSDDIHGQRAVCIILDHPHQRVLLLHRIKAGREYYTLPGGKLKMGETPAQACAREALEETGLTVSVRRKIRELVNLGKVEHYFLASEFHGVVALGGPELMANCPENFYEPMWVPIEQVERLNLLPVEAVAMVKEAAG